MLWAGTIDGDQRLSVIGYQTVFGTLGSALSFNVNGSLVVVNYNLYEFKTLLNHNGLPDQHPERLPLELLPPAISTRSYAHG